MGARCLLQTERRGEREEGRARHAWPWGGPGLLPQGGGTLEGCGRGGAEPSGVEWQGTQEETGDQASHKDVEAGVGGGRREVGGFSVHLEAKPTKSATKLNVGRGWGSVG